MAAITLSIVIEDFLVDDVESFRQKQIKYSGYLSRSRAIRMLIAKGLEAVADEAELKREARRRKAKELIVE